MIIPLDEEYQELDFTNNKIINYNHMEEDDIYPKMAKKILKEIDENII